MAQINWTKQALGDLEALGDYIARDSPAIAQVFVNRIINSIAGLESFPLSGGIVPEAGRESIREVIFRNYRIVYSLENDTIHILTIFHASKALTNLIDDISGQMVNQNFGEVWVKHLRHNSQTLHQNLNPQMLNPLHFQRYVPKL